MSPLSVATRSIKEAREETSELYQKTPSKEPTTSRVQGNVVPEGHCPILYSFFFGDEHDYQTCELKPK